MILRPGIISLPYFWVSVSFDNPTGMEPIPPYFTSKQSETQFLSNSFPFFLFQVHFWKTAAQKIYLRYRTFRLLNFQPIKYLP